MIPPVVRREFYQALLEKNAAYEGLFFVGVTTTGVFCRPTCPARKPKFANCEFYETAEEALLASFRPCKRCRPLTLPGQATELVQKLVEAVENHPEKRWTSADFAALSVDAATVRRQFKQRFGMTFVAYARARRMGIAMKEIRAGGRVIDAQLTVGYESSSGFRDAFSQIMGSPPCTAEKQRILYASWLDTRLGAMVVIADEEELYLLEFVNRRGLEREVERLRAKLGATIIPGRTKAIDAIDGELSRYFTGDVQQFTTPVALVGTPFQSQVWRALRTIPFGETRSYSEIASVIEHPTAFRAVARANGANQLAIIVPCHRVIGANGDLTGYGGGIKRKQWLIEHERAKKE